MVEEHEQMTAVAPATGPAEAGAPVQAPDAASAGPSGLWLLAPLASAALAACGGGTADEAFGVVGAARAVRYRYTKPKTEAEASRFLQQAQLSVSTTDISNVMRNGFQPWLAAQFNLPQGQTGWDWLVSRGYSQIDSTTRFFDSTSPGDYMIWNQLMTAPDGVRKRFALALSEFFVVSLSGLSFNWRFFALASWWDMLVKNAFGNFRQLLEDVTLHPAMGYYLNTKGNQKEDPVKGRMPDENYSREVMQLFTIGLYQLNPDGTEKTDAGGNRIETYTNDDVTNLARVFTGYDFDYSQTVYTTLTDINRKVPDIGFTRLPMALNASRHSMLEARFLGTTIPANTEGKAALKIALDALFNHPNVGPFFGRQMIQRLVTSNPSPAYVARVAAAFANNGLGVRGDLRAVLSAILLDDEARGMDAALRSTTSGRLREPMLRFIQWGRTFGLNSAYGSWKIGDLSNPASQLGQSPLRSASVFNFFRPGYVPPSTALASRRLVAPEMQLVNESSVGGYLNYFQNLIQKGLYVNAPDQPHSGSNATNGYDIKATYTSELAIVTDATALVNRLNLLLCAGQMSSANRTLIINALNATPVTSASTDAVKLNRVAAAVLMVMASADYLVLK